MGALHIESFAVGPLGCNCSILADLEARTAIVIDPGGELARIRARLGALGVVPSAIVHTHTHIDHVGATAGLVAATGARPMIHEADRFLYDMLPVQAAMLGIALPERTEMEGSLEDGAAVSSGSFEIGVLHTPGHTPGSVSFVCAGDGAGHVFTGDTLFRRGVGRTDLWGGDTQALLRSIRGKLLSLADETVVVAGHGPSTTVGEERAKNPFLR